MFKKTKTAHAYPPTVNCYGSIWTGGHYYKKVKLAKPRLESGRFQDILDPTYSSIKIREVLLVGVQTAVYQLMSEYKGKPGWYHLILLIFMMKLSGP